MSLSENLSEIATRLRLQAELPYNLRRTPGRRSLHKQYQDELSGLNDLDDIAEEPELLDELDESEDSDSELEIPAIPDRIPIDFNMATAVITNATKFTGNISDKTDPEKARLESYTVHQFLADLDSRIASQKITDEAAKIKEAQWLIDKDKGDARVILLSPQFAELKTYKAFKAKCIEVFQPKDYKDKFYNLQQLRALKVQGSEYTYMVDIRKAIDNVVNDIVANNNIVRVNGGPRHQMADIREVISYVSYGTIYAMMPEEYKAAFKKIQLDPREDHFTLLNNLKEKISENKVRTENEITAAIQTKGASPVKSTEKPTTSSNQTGKNYGSTTYQKQNNKGKTSQGQGQYKNNTTNRGGYSSNYSQGYNYNYGRSSNRGRGQQSYHNRNKTECRRCGRTNHKTHECISCDYCNRIGHYSQDCYQKQRDRNQQSQNN